MNTKLFSFSICHIRLQTWILWLHFLRHYHYTAGWFSRFFCFHYRPLLNLFPGHVGLHPDVLSLFFTFKARKHYLFIGKRLAFLPPRWVDDFTFETFWLRLTDFVYSDEGVGKGVSRQQQLPNIVASWQAIHSQCDNRNMPAKVGVMKNSLRPNRIIGIHTAAHGYGSSNCFFPSLRCFFRRVVRAWWNIGSKDSESNFAQITEVGMVGAFILVRGKNEDCWTIQGASNSSSNSGVLPIFISVFHDFRENNSYYIPVKSCLDDRQQPEFFFF